MPQRGRVRRQYGRRDNQICRRGGCSQYRNSRIGYSNHQCLSLIAGCRKFQYRGGRTRSRKADLRYPRNYSGSVEHDGRNQIVILAVAATAVTTVATFSTNAAGKTNAPLRTRRAAGINGTGCVDRRTILSSGSSRKVKAVVE